MLDAAEASKAAGDRWAPMGPTWAYWESMAFPQVRGDVTAQCQGLLHVPWRIQQCPLPHRRGGTGKSSVVPGRGPSAWDHCRVTPGLPGVATVSLSVPQKKAVSPFCASPLQSSWLYGWAAATVASCSMSLAVVIWSHHNTNMTPLMRSCFLLSSEIQ